MACEGGVWVLTRTRDAQAVAAAGKVLDMAIRCCTRAHAHTRTHTRTHAHARAHTLDFQPACVPRSFQRRQTPPPLESTAATAPVL